MDIREIKIVPQTAYTAGGIVTTYGLIVKGYPRRYFTSIDELIIYLRCYIGND